MTTSIFSPCHNTKYLRELYDTIKDQDFTEWILVPNGEALKDDFSWLKDDSRVKIIPFTKETKSIGELKRFCCSQATGDILIEVDADDLLTPDAIEYIKKAFEDPEISFAYSQFCEFYFDHPQFKDWESPKYNEYYGWRYKDFEWQGHILNECIDFDPVPSVFQMIWYAPNHIRAWRTTHYWAVGGHNPELEAVDDFDLELRTYLYGKMYHIKKCLYLYRINGQNQWIQKNQYIQRVAKEKAEEYFYKITYRWAELNNWKTVNIEDIKGDLNKKWKLKDNSVGIIKAWDRLQLLDNPQHAMNEIYRVLVPGGYLLSSTPSTDGRGAFQNPNHKSFWNENSFYYYIDRNESYKINNKTRFQAVRHRTFFPDQYHQDRNIPFVLFDAIVLKEGTPRLPGGINI